MGVPINYRKNYYQQLEALAKRKAVAELVRTALEQIEFAKILPDIYPKKLRDR